MAIERNIYVKCTDTKHSRATPNVSIFLLLSVWLLSPVRSLSCIFFSCRANATSAAILALGRKSEVLVYLFFAFLFILNFRDYYKCGAAATIVYTKQLCIYCICLMEIKHIYRSRNGRVRKSQRITWVERRKSNKHVNDKTSRICILYAFTATSLFAVATEGKKT